MGSEAQCRPDIQRAGGYMKTSYRLGSLKLIALVTVLIALPEVGLALTPTPKTVPWAPNDVTIPHDTYAGKSITLKGTSDVQGPNIKATWDFGDGSPVANFVVTDRFDVEATHIYVGPVNSKWTATLTVQDTNQGGGSASKPYLVIMRDDNLTSNVNVAIDEGLWYLHKTMFRSTSGLIDYGDWYSGCGGFACYGAYALTATNVQAFEVNGHLESGSASNPYTETVARGMKSVFAWLN